MFRLQVSSLVRCSFDCFTYIFHLQKYIRRYFFHLQASKPLVTGSTVLVISTSRLSRYWLDYFYLFRMQIYLKALLKPTCKCLSRYCWVVLPIYLFPIRVYGSLVASHMSCFKVLLKKMFARNTKTPQPNDTCLTTIGGENSAIKGVFWVKLPANVQAVTVGCAPVQRDDGLGTARREDAVFQ